MTTTLREQTIATTSKVVRAAVAVHSSRRRTVLEIPLLEMVHVSVAADTATMPGIVVIEDRVVELVVDDGPFEALAPAVWALSARGWEVVALAAAPRMGEAHRALRGTPCRLQSWWEEDHAIKFGAFEIP